MRTELTAERQRIVNDSPLVQTAIKMGCVVVKVENTTETQGQLMPLSSANVEPVNAYEKDMMRLIYRDAKNSQNISLVIRAKRKQPIQPRRPARRL